VQLAEQLFFYAHFFYNGLYHQLTFPQVIIISCTSQLGFQLVNFLGGTSSLTYCSSPIFKDVFHTPVNKLIFQIYQDNLKTSFCCHLCYSGTHSASTYNSYFFNQFYWPPPTFIFQ